jgi:hypothetical protein
MKVGATALGAVTGFALFLCCYFPLAFAAHFPASAPFDYFVNGFRRQGAEQSVLTAVRSHLEAGGGVIYYMTPGLWIAATVVCVLVVLTRRPYIDRLGIIFLFGMAVSITIGYAAITGSPFGFPKYWGIAVLPLALAVSAGSAEVLSQWKPAPLRRRSALLAIAGTATCCSALWTYVHVGNRMGHAHPPLGAVFEATVVLMVLVCAISLVAILGLSLGRGHRFRPVMAVVAAVAVVVPAIVCQTAVDADTRSASYSTRYYYGERGLAAVIRYLRDHTPSSATLISAKDVGLQSGRQFYEDAFVLPLAPTALRAYLARNPAAYLVSRAKWDYSPLVFPAQFEVLKEFFAPISDQPSPDFVIWQRRTQGAVGQ